MNADLFMLITYIAVRHADNISWRVRQWSRHTECKAVVTVLETELNGV